MNLSGSARITTSSGKTIDLMNLHEGDITIEDIATGLSHVCRFGEQCKFFYSVAQHSIMGSKYSTPSNKLPFLLHDASEAYMSDIVSDLKHQLNDYKYIESRVQSKIYDEFGVFDYNALEIKMIDKLMRTTEARVLMGEDLPWVKDLPFVHEKIEFVNFDTVKDEFLKTFALYESYYRANTV